MSKELKILLFIMSFFYLIIIIFYIKRKKIQLNFSMFWILSGVVLMLSSLFSGWIEVISRYLGFETPSNMVFCTAIFLAYYLVFVLTIRLSAENAKNTKLIQEVSILKQKVELMEYANKEEKENEN